MKSIGIAAMTAAAQGQPARTVRVLVPFGKYRWFEVESTMALE